MLIAARNVQAICAAQLWLMLVGIGIFVGAANAQSHDVFGPPTATPVVAQTPPVAVEQVSSTRDAEADASDADPIAEPVAKPIQSMSQTGGRFLGSGGASADDAELATGAGQTNADPTKGMGKSAWATAVVLSLIVFAALAVRTIAKRQGGLMASLGPGGRAPGGLLEVLGRYPIGRGQTLVLLKIDQRVLLLSQSAGGRLGAGAGMSTLCEMTDPEEVASILIKSRDEGGDSMADRFRFMLAGQSSAAPLPRASSVGRTLLEGDIGDTAEIWDESQAVETLSDRADEWPVQSDSSALGSLRSRLEHWRDVEATA